MKDLKCGQKNCSFNSGYCCCAKHISVGGDTDCKSYTYNPASLFEAGSDFASADFSVDTKVECAADCLFMRDRKCIANGITVHADHGSKASCLTFIKS
ncbi:MAG: DUF1540 domain-containing protein [Firmicutes bacterium]|nr:DUF1540 domain-containing protein [Bacillota bacterium]